MKKFALLLLATLFATTVFAQEWSVGGRLGSGLQAVGQYHFNDKNYLEGRFGASWLGVISADFTMLYNWKVKTMDWTDKGTWFFDSGVALNIGGVPYYAYLAVGGMFRLGYTFESKPVSLSFDYTPLLGVGCIYDRDLFGIIPRLAGIGNFGITCTYNF